jgi:hypothetical protein
MSNSRDEQENLAFLPQPYGPVYAGAFNTWSSDDPGNGSGSLRTSLIMNNLIALYIHLNNG